MNTDSRREKLPCVSVCIRGSARGLHIHGFILATMLFGLAVPVGYAQGADERAFWLVWQKHTENLEKHAEAVAACREFERQAPDDPLAVVVRQFAAWHLLKLGKSAEARTILAPSVTGRATAFHRVADDVARAWLTRLDRDALQAHLRQTYLRDVAFPVSLDALAAPPGAERPPLVDRWGKPWAYRLVGFKHLKGFDNQKYELQSQRLGSSSDLAKVLAMPYAGRITLRPVKLVSSASGSTLVQFADDAASGPAAKKPIQMRIGSRCGWIVFAYMGEHIILLADEDHWKAVAKPRR